MNTKYKPQLNIIDFEINLTLSIHFFPFAGFLLFQSLYVNPFPSSHHPPIHSLTHSLGECMLRIRLPFILHIVIEIQ